jgi:hypothetical protein
MHAITCLHMHCSLRDTTYNCAACTFQLNYSQVVIGEEDSAVNSEYLALRKLRPTYFSAPIYVLYDGLLSVAQTKSLSRSPLCSRGIPATKKSALGVTGASSQTKRLLSVHKPEGYGCIRNASLTYAEAIRPLQLTLLLQLLPFSHSLPSSKLRLNGRNAAVHHPQAEKYALHLPQRRHGNPIDSTFASPLLRHSALDFAGVN